MSHRRNNLTVSWSHEKKGIRIVGESSVSTCALGHSVGDHAAEEGVSREGQEREMERWSGLGN